MLRNADDNSFSKARARKEEPYVKFNVASRYIIFECNKDNSFTNGDLTAIYSISKSSKIGAQGYTEEKGNGSGSVFTVAYKVHAQPENSVSESPTLLSGAIAVKSLLVLACVVVALHHPKPFQKSLVIGNTNLRIEAVLSSPQAWRLGD